MNTNTFVPATGSQAEWNAAYYRLDDYFRALHLADKVAQSQIILRLLELAAARHAKDPDQNPTTLAMIEARAALDSWCEAILQRQNRISTVSLLSLLAVDAAEKWPIAFLSNDIPADLRREMEENDLRAGPDLQVSSMVPRPIDVSPLLDEIHLTSTLEKPGWNLALIVALLLTAASVSLFLFLR